MPENKNHWYDGLFYDKIIAPHQDEAFYIVKSLINENSSVLDVGCGTGRLEFQLEDKCGKIDGIDLSKRNINIANINLSKASSSKISFFHMDVQKFLENGGMTYDYSVLSYVIHELDKDKREDILILLSDKCRQIIIVDYLFPPPKSFASFLNEAVEFAAGINHYKNYKSFLSDKGIAGLSEKTGLEIVKEIKNNPIGSHIAVLSKSQSK